MNPRNEDHSKLSQGSTDDSVYPVKKCPACGEAMTQGGRAILCFGGGEAGTLDLPAHCTSRQCREQRDADAIEKAIAAGVIYR